ncbi:hypothetical protein BV898_03167 [Hypsibius exemplaris]|uniref:Syntaxin N-terminal domain-containing protein n=1 Tax=Hypsibius exemplaris TaxID=2072580 RepID=A0A1W0X570_HYPEX|nr:hypothetical protein BV898_03167 [Hypsibius exemplaris]
MTSLISEVERLRQIEIDVHARAKETEEMIQQKLKENLVRQFNDALDRFQKAQRLVAQKDRDSIVRARAQRAK